MFHIHLDIKDLVDLRERISSEAEKAVKKAGQMLAAATHAHIVEQVQGKLRSTREKYLENLGFHQVNDNTWVVDLAPGAFFIEDGLPAGFDMIPGLLDDSARPGAKSKPGASKGRTKTAADGSRYRVIPFEHNKAQTRQTPYAKDLTDTIKTELKRRGAPGLGTIEKDSGGQPRLGLVRKMDIMTAPKKIAEGPGQGKGPLGAVRQGPTGIPLLQGVRIYQQKVKDKVSGKERIQKTAMTFRVVSSKHTSQGRWQHPGLEPRRFLDEAYVWALEEWKSKIGPEIAKSFGEQL